MVRTPDIHILWLKLAVVYALAPVSSAIQDLLPLLLPAPPPEQQQQQLLLPLPPLTAENEITEDEMGCTDSAASNYSPDAKQDDGRCVYTCVELRASIGAVPSAICGIFSNEQWPNGLISHATGDTITIPTDEHWVVQGRPVSGASSAQELPFRFRVDTTDLILRCALVKPPSGGAQSGGGVLASRSELQLERVAFDKLQAQNGGAMHLAHSNVGLVNVTFNNAAATSDGGAIWVESSVLTILNAIFRHASVSGRGGAIYAASSNISISSSIFHACAADDQLAGVGDSLFMTQCDSIVILGTNFEPFDEEATVVFDMSWLRSMGGCAKHPCGPGFSCSYSEYSLACTRCSGGTIGDGLQCTSCGSGRGPTAQHSGCERCIGNSYSKNDTSMCGCAAVRAAAPQGYYNVTFGLLVCFRDGYDMDEVAKSRDLYAVDQIDARICQKCPDCADCSGPMPKLRPGYISDGLAIHTSASPGWGERYAYLCDSDTAITEEDEDEFHYLTSALATKRCPGGSLMSSVCAQGYEGYFCQSCTVNYHRGSLDGHKPCWRCPATSAVLVAVRVAVLVAVSIIIFIGRTIYQKYDVVETEAAASLLNPSAAAMANRSCSSRFSSRLPPWSVLWAITKMPVKIVITYAQVVGQLNAVLHVPFPNHFQSVMGHFSWGTQLWELLFSPDCVGLGGFVATWVLRCCVLPCFLCLVVLLLYFYDSCGPDSAHAGQTSRQRLFFCMFLVYPSISNVAFSAFLCRPYSPGSSVLVSDDRLRCEGHEISDVLQPLSIAVILFVAVGLPILFAVVIIFKAKQHAKSFQNLFAASTVNDSASQSLQDFQRAVDTDTSAAAAVLVHRDVTCLNEYAFMIESYRPDVTYWESLDMIRKLSLVGVVVLVGRGSVAQIAFGSMSSFLFFALHVKVWPLKSYEDNLFRMAAELHVFWVITIAFVLKSDLKHESLKLQFYDTILIISFVLCIPCGLIATILTKIYRAQAAGILSARGSQDDCKQAFARYQSGLSSSAERRLLREQFETIQGQSAQQLRRSLSLLASSE
eukprot:COSAG05_NODE_368_length_10734_cov_4.853315_3_plen_1041_part_00